MTLPDAAEVAPPREGQLRRLLLALLGAGLLLGLVIGGGSWVLGTVAQTEAGLCRVTWAPCTELSLASIESLSGLDLPEGTEVVSGYAQELGSLLEFRAEVVLPEGATVSMSSAYEPTDDADVPAAADLENAGSWSRPVRDPDGHDLAVLGQRDGRTVIVFDERQVPQAP